MIEINIQEFQTKVDQMENHIFFKELSQKQKQILDQKMKQTQKNKKKNIYDWRSDDEDSIYSDDSDYEVKLAEQKERKEKIKLEKQKQLNEAQQLEQMIKEEDAEMSKKEYLRDYKFHYENIKIA